MIMAELSSYLAGEGGIMGILATKRPKMMPIKSLDLAKLRFFLQNYTSLKIICHFSSTVNSFGDPTPDIALPYRS